MTGAGPPPQQVAGLSLELAAPVPPQQGSESGTAALYEAAHSSEVGDSAAAAPPPKPKATHSSSRQGMGAHAPFVSASAADIKAPDSSGMRVLACGRRSHPAGTTRCCLMPVMLLRIVLASATIARCQIGWHVLLCGLMPHVQSLKMSFESVMRGAPMHLTAC